METITETQLQPIATIQGPEELIPVLCSSGAEVSIQNQVVKTLVDFITKAKEWNTTIESLQITSADEIGKMKMAKEGRLTLKNMRLNGKKTVEAIRKSIKDRMSSDIIEDKLWMKSWQIVEDIYDNLESKLEEKENFAKKLEEERIKKLKEDRETQLTPYSAFVPFGIDLANMGDDDFQKVLSGAKLQHEAKVDQDRKAEELKQKTKVFDDRRFMIAQYQQFYDAASLTVDTNQEEFDAMIIEAKSKKSGHDKEQARIKAENERLKKESEEKQKEIERQAAEKIRLQKEAEEKQKQQAKEAQERKLQLEKQELENKRIREESEQKEKALDEEKAKNISLKNELKSSVFTPSTGTGKVVNLGDQDELRFLADRISAIQLPDLKSASAKKVVSDVKILLQKVSDHIIKQL
jgi:hypothetical protein